MYDFAKDIAVTDKYNYHSHTQFCDGRADMSAMASAASEAGFDIWGFSPHSPLCQPSPCNMLRTDVPQYLDEARRLGEEYHDRMRVLVSMEIDFMSRDFGPHIDYFRKLPLDYRIGSVHFVPTRDGVWIDCDGSYERFAKNLHTEFRDDLRYVVEKYFEQVLTMIELGGFDLLGHFDKIAGNAACADPSIESRSWYAALVDDVVNHAADAGIALEINTKSFGNLNRFFPAEQWWNRIPENVTLTVNSDAHYPERINSGRQEALDVLRRLHKYAKSV